MKTKNYLTVKITLLLLSILLSGHITFAQAVMAGPNHGVSTVVLANSANTWKDAANVFFPDNQYASARLAIGEVSDTMEIGNFHFDIPANAIIKGITVTIRKGATAGGITDNTIKLVRNGVVGGTEHAQPSEWPTNPGVFTYGGSNDLWGRNWMPSDINLYSFGLAISVTNSVFNTDSANAEVDYVSISVNYTVPENVVITGFVDHSDKKTPGMLIAPNPGHNRLTVRFPSQGNAARLMIMDSNGKIAISQTVPVAMNTGNTTCTQDISALSPGTYFLLVNNGTQNYTNTFVKR